MKLHRHLNDLPIRWKQVLVIVTTSTTALLLACGAFMAYDAFNFRRELSGQMASLAHVVGNNLAAAIDFNDAAAANETLAALRGEPSIVHAHVHAAGGTALAEYLRDGADAPEDLTLPGDGEVFRGGHLYLFRGIRAGGETVGTIEIVADLNALHERLWRYAGIAGLVFGASLLVILILSARLQRIISRPIVELARVARKVATEKDYTVRAKAHSRDELGQLIENFNEMLREIALRDDALEKARVHLERRVEERTGDLLRAQQEIEAERARFQLIFESVPVGISLRHVHGDGSEAAFLINQAHLDICGVSRQQAADQGIFRRLTHPDDFDRQDRTLRELGRDGRTQAQLEKRYVRPDGKVAWVTLSVKRRLLPDGGIEDLSTIVDITELKKAQEDAAREQARFKFIFESVPVGISWFVPEQEETHLVNPAHVRLTGISAEESRLPGAFARVSHPEDYARQKELTDRFVRGEIDHYALEKRYLHPGGRVVWVSLTSRMFTDPATGAQQSVTTLVDVTERRRAEDELRTKTALLEAQEEASIDGILVVDAQGRRIFQNRRTNEIWGIPASIQEDPDDARQIDFILQRLRDPAAFLTQVKHLYAHPQEVSHDEIELKDGTVLDRYSGPVVGRDGTHYGRIWMFRDITERKRAEAELEKVHRELLDTSRQAGMAEIATGVLHNVGNVLNSVNVSATVVGERIARSEIANLTRVCALLREQRDDLGKFFSQDPRGRKLPAFLETLAEHLATEQRELLEEISHLRSNIEHIKEIVAMQQAYAKVSGVAEAVAVVDLVQDALRMNAGALSRHSVQVTRDFQASPVITVEKHKVLQILVNLIRNAKYACDDSGREDKRIALRVATDARMVRIVVEDNGVGIPPENLTRIFAHGFTTRKEGHGFGLHSGAIAAKEMGGALRAQSEGPGRGAVFTLELPLQSRETETASPALVLQS